MHGLCKSNILQVISGSALFRNHVNVAFPLLSHLRKSRSKYKNSVKYSSISKCDAER